MSKKKRRITGREPRLGKGEAAPPPRSMNLPGLGGKIGVMRLAEYLDHPDRRVRERAMFELARLGDDRVLDDLLKMMESEQPHRSQRAIHALGLLGNPRAARPLMDYFVGTRHKDPLERAAAVALRRICKAHPEIHEEVYSFLLDRLHYFLEIYEDYPYAMSAIALMLGAIGDARAVRPLSIAVHHIIEGSSMHWLPRWEMLALAMIAKRHAHVAPGILQEMRCIKCRTYPDDGIEPILMIGLQYERLAGPVVEALAERIPTGSIFFEDTVAYWNLNLIARALGKMSMQHPSTTQRVIDLLIPLLEDPCLEDPALALARIDDERTDEALRRTFAAREPAWKTRIAEAMGIKGMIEPLIEMLATDIPARHSWAIKGLAACSDPRAVEVLIGALASGDDETRACAAKALGTMHTPLAVQPLIGVLAARSTEARQAAAKALGEIEKAHPGTAEPSAPMLIPLLHDEIRSVQVAAAKTLAQIQTEEAQEAVWQFRFPAVRSET